MSLVSGRINRSAIVAIVGFLFLAGCSGDSWNWGGQPSNKNQAGAKARKPAQQPTADAKPRGQKPKADQDSAEAERLNKRINNHYAHTESRGHDDRPYYDDSLNSKIERQNDPKRQDRMKQSAETAYDKPQREAAESGGADSKTAKGPAQPNPRSQSTKSADSRRGDPVASADRGKGATDGHVPESTASRTPSRDEKRAPSRAGDPNATESSSRDMRAANASHGKSTNEDEIKDTSGQAHSGANGRQVAIEDNPEDRPQTARTNRTSPTRANEGAGRQEIEPGESNDSGESSRPRDDRGDSPQNDESQSAGDAAARSTKPSNRLRSRPPALGSVSVASEPASRSPDESDDPREPVVIAKTNKRMSVEPSSPPGTGKADTLGGRIRDLEAAVTQSPNNLEKQFTLRLLYLATEQDEKATSPTPGMDVDLAELIAAHVRAIKAARTGPVRDPAAWANSQLSALQSLMEMVESKADLQVPVVRLCTSVDGYGMYDPIDASQLVAGRLRQVIVYIEVGNFRSQRMDHGKQKGMYKTVLSIRQSLLGKDGHEIMTHEDKNVEDFARNRRRDFFLAARLDIPKGLQSGDYILKVEVEDELAEKINSKTVPFVLRAG